MFKAHRLLYHSTLGLIVIEKKKEGGRHFVCTSDLAHGDVDPLVRPMARGRST